MTRDFQRELSEIGLEGVGRYYALYRAIVVDNNDPEKRGRLKVKIPSVYGDQVFEEWIYGRMVFNGIGIGIWAIPSIGSGVYVSFLDGNPELPIWQMGWFADSELPDEFKDRYLDGITLKNDRVFIQSKNADIELFEDGNIVINSKQDTLINSSGKVETDSTSSTIFKSKTTIEVNALGDIDIKSTGGRIGIQNSAFSLLLLMQELMLILTTFRVANGSAPLNTNLFVDTQTAITALTAKITALLK